MMIGKFRIRKKDIQTLKVSAEEIHKNTLDLMRSAGTVHVGSNLSVLDILNTYYYFNRTSNNTQLLLSKGQAVACLLTVMEHYRLIDRQQLFTYARNKGMFSPALSYLENGVFTYQAASLGNTLGFVIGKALAQPEIRYYVVVGDGECDEGVFHEAIRLIGSSGLKNITLLVDYNGFTAGNRASYAIGQLQNLFKVLGWKCDIGDAHSYSYLEKIFTKQKHRKPVVHICKSVFSKGLTSWEGHNDSRYHPL